MKQASIDPEPQLVAQHQQDAIPAPNAQRSQVVRDLRRATRHLLEGSLQLASVVVDDVQGRRVVVARHLVEVIQSPVEVFKPRPLKVTAGGHRIVAVAQQESRACANAWEVVVGIPEDRSTTRSAWHRDLRIRR